MKFVTYVDDFHYTFNKDYLSGAAWIDYDNKNDHSTYRISFKGNITKGGANYVYVCSFQSFKAHLKSTEKSKIFLVYYTIKSKKPKEFPKHFSLIPVKSIF